MIFGAISLLSHSTHKNHPFSGSFSSPTRPTVDTIVHQEMIYYTCPYTYFYNLSTAEGKVSSRGRAILCH